MNVAAMTPPRIRPARMDTTMRTARLCYDHCAGLLGVGLADGLRERGHIELSDDGGVVTLPGTKFLTDFGIDIEALQKHRRVFCKPCLDWSERRPHLAGTVGGALARRLFALGWIERVRDTRALRDHSRRSWRAARDIRRHARRTTCRHRPHRLKFKIMIDVSPGAIGVALIFVLAGFVKGVIGVGLPTIGVGL